MTRPPDGIPPGLAEQRGLGDRWVAWIDGLGTLADDITDAWELDYDGEPRHGFNGVVFPVRTVDHRPAALKLVLVDEESRGEIPALQRWAGTGAVELWRADPRRGALLLERLGPSDLNELDDLDACDEVAQLYGELHVAPTPKLPDLRSLVARWLDGVGTLPRHAVPSRFAEQAVSAGARLLAVDPTSVVHGDLHYDNVLRRRDRALTIGLSRQEGSTSRQPLMSHSSAVAASTGSTSGRSARRTGWRRVPPSLEPR
ncbi:MAG TPA: aminoglycoside phosphotransferase family protein [Propionibacteriaceae bacterium]|nr:aminoglycoside phosphotransferase family protein [Propionibacteriaceae bacterium]